MSIAAATLANFELTGGFLTTLPLWPVVFVVACLFVFSGYSFANSTARYASAGGRTRSFIGGVVLLAAAAAGVFVLRAL